MDKEELEAIIEKYRKKSENRSFFGDDKCAEFEDIADYIEENMFVLRNFRILVYGEAS